MLVPADAKGHACETCLFNPVGPSFRRAAHCHHESSTCCFCLNNPRLPARPSLPSCPPPPATTAPSPPDPPGQLSQSPDALLDTHSTLQAVCHRSIQWVRATASPSSLPTKVRAIIWLKRRASKSIHGPPRLTPSVNLNHFRLLRVVGKGAFGKVRIVERKDTGLTFALKYIRKDEGSSPCPVHPPSTPRADVVSQSYARKASATSFASGACSNT